MLQTRGKCLQITYESLSVKDLHFGIHMDSVGEGEGGKIWENGIETCKISCMK